MRDELQDHIHHCLAAWLPYAEEVLGPWEWGTRGHLGRNIYGSGMMTIPSLTATILPGVVRQLFLPFFVYGELILVPKCIRLDPGLEIQFSTLASAWF